jgi:molybdenum cofactor cytidylyltransferase
LTTNLSGALGLGERDLVAFVGAGGKSTLMFTLAQQLVAAGRTVVITTTTKMGAGQMDRFPNSARSTAPEDVAAALERAGPVLVIEMHDRHKVTGLSPEAVGDVFAQTNANYVLVEADGAHGRSFKAPASHEPVIPEAATIVVIVFGADAFGRPISEEAHRPELVAGLAGCEVGDVITPEVAAMVLGHHDGGLRGVPAEARTVVAITKVDRDEDGSEVDELIGLLFHHPGIGRVALIPQRGSSDTP